MPLIIVTKRLYLTCEDVLSITVDELDSNKHSNKAAKNAALVVKNSTKDSRKYSIVITHRPLPGSVARYEEHVVTIDVRGYKETLQLFSEIVNQIREQKPDQLYLDKLVEKMLTTPMQEGTTSND